WLPARSHPEDPKLRLRDRRVVSGRDRERQGRARLRGIEHTIVPEAGGRVIRTSLRLVFLPSGALALRNLLRPHPPLARAHQLTLLSCGDPRRGLGPPHPQTRRVGPHQEKARPVGAPAHAVVAGPERSPDDDGELGNRRIGDGVDHLRSILGYAPLFILTSD